MIQTPAVGLLCGSEVPPEPESWRETCAEQQFVARRCGLVIQTPNVGPLCGSEMLPFRESLGSYYRAREFGERYAEGSPLGSPPLVKEPRSGIVALVGFFGGRSLRLAKLGALIILGVPVNATGGQ